MIQLTKYDHGRVTSLSVSGNQEWHPGNAFRSSMLRQTSTSSVQQSHRNAGDLLMATDVCHWKSLREEHPEPKAKFGRKRACCGSVC